MSISNKIQLYRKQLGMSQEELGQKLLVSRQTISLWEKGQTVPTIDNLIRLKDIFGVSVDEILDCNNDTEEIPVPPTEFYRFHYSKAEITQVCRVLRRQVLTRFFLFFTISVIIILLFIGNSASESFIWFFLGLLVTDTIVSIKGIAAHGKSWARMKEKIPQNTYEYEIFQDYIVISIYKNTEKTQSLKVNIEEIQQIQDIGKYLIMVCSGLSLILKKSELSQTSIFYTFMKNHPKKTYAMFPNKWKIWSRLLFIASFLSMLGAVGLTSLAGSGHVLTNNMWLFFTMTPIPIASIVLGVYLKKKGYKYKKNIVAGIIMIIVLCIYGSFTFIFSNTYTNSDEPIVKLEQYTKIDIPEYVQINTQTMMHESSTTKEFVYYLSNVYFNSENAKQFERQIAEDDKWLTSLPNEMMGTLSFFTILQNYDYILVYNIDEGEYNQSPSTSGTYHFISAVYHAKNRQMEIVEYKIDYIK